MNEFIVWDKKSKKFRVPREILFDTSSKFDKDFPIQRVQMWGQPFADDGEQNPNIIVQRKSNEVTFHRHIGKTDINGNKIYADSSIVKVHDKRSRFYNNICKITYNKSVCSYMLKTLDFEDEYQEHLKSDYRNNYYEIIGTLQKDKHLLGKENL